MIDNEYCHIKMVLQTFISIYRLKKILKWESGIVKFFNTQSYFLFLLHFTTHSLNWLNAIPCWKLLFWLFAEGFLLQLAHCLFPIFISFYYFCANNEKLHQRERSEGRRCVLDLLRRPNWRAIIPESHTHVVREKKKFKQGTINDISKAETWDWQSSRRTLSSCWQLWKLLFLTLQSPQWGEWLFEAISLWFILGKDKQTESRALNSHSKPESTHAHSFCATHQWMLRVLLFKMIHSLVTQLSTNC